MTPRRSVGGLALTGLLTLLLLCGCTPATPNAWRLNGDGTVGFATCAEFRATQLDVTYLKEGAPVAHVIAEGEERSFEAGGEIMIAPEHWLVSTTLDGVSDWDTAIVSFSIAPFPFGTSQWTGGKRDPSSLDEVLRAEIPRSQLREGQWVWDQPGRTCETGPASSGEPIYTGALSRESFDAITREHPDLTSLVDALTSLGRVAPILAFQSMLLDDLNSAALPGEDLPDTLARTRPDTSVDALLAAELAVSRLGFTWDADAVRVGALD